MQNLFSRTVCRVESLTSSDDSLPGYKSIAPDFLGVDAKNFEEFMKKVMESHKSASIKNTDNHQNTSQGTVPSAAYPRASTLKFNPGGGDDTPRANLAVTAMKTISSMRIMPSLVDMKSDLTSVDEF